MLLEVVHSICKTGCFQHTRQELKTGARKGQAVTYLLRLAVPPTVVSHQCGSAQANEPDSGPNEMNSALMPLGGTHN